jgi:phosphatidylserine/phosphatidylglycerophosphate/cardiolipin synthase-like enzyme
LVGEFAAEMLKAGNAIIHDKIVVIDPLSDNPVVACGSHNLGYKASYGNDENLLILQGNQSLAQAYAVHVLDIYDHYRFRAEQQASHGKAFAGFLQDNDTWQQDYIEGRRGPDAAYFANG